MQLLLRQDQCMEANQSIEETVHSVVESLLDILQKLNFKRQNCRLLLESSQNQQLFYELSDLLERLSNLLQAETTLRTYRDNFSQAYKVLFHQKQLCYLPEIYDGAQEGFHCLFVNGYQYFFSEEIVQKGQALVDHFLRLQSYFLIFREKSKQCNEASYNFLKQLLKHAFEEFDFSWVVFEKAYIGELMMIEQAAKCIMDQAVYSEHLLQEFQKQQRLRGKIFLAGQEYDNLRRNLCANISQLNSVANVEGKGRDDLHYDILIEAQNLLRSVSIAQSKAVRVIADKIKKTFESIRELLRVYRENPDIVDPHLKNNLHLSTNLYKYQQCWEKGNRYFLQVQKKQQLINLSHMIETTQEKYPQFMEMVQCSDPQLFLIIPSLIILKSLEGEDKGLVRYFFTDIDKEGTKYNIQYNKIKGNYQDWKLKHSASGGYLYYNLLESQLVERRQDSKSFSSSIRQLAIELQRINPLQWNNLLQAATQVQ